MKKEGQEKESFREWIKREAREWTETLVYVIVIVFFLETFLIQAFKIPSGSMIPTFQIGDRIFVSKFLYSARIPFINITLPIHFTKDPKRGDIIVFVSPEDPKKDFVKRLIAFGGETVEIRDGRIYVDNKVIDDIASIKNVRYYNSGDYGGESQVVKVPNGSYYALGDNSSSSRDSRFWGFVPRKNLIGKAVLIYWPLHRAKVIK